MSDMLALLFGAVIVFFFAYERFNSAGYEGFQQFERLVAYLSPDKLRARRVILRAYLFYAATLVAIYLFLCTYAQVLPLLGASGIPADAIGATSIGAQEGGANADGSWRGLGISPSISLSVALIMVGLAPSFPILDRFEHWMRSTAHRLAGIPTRVIEVADNLRHSRLAFKVPEGTTVPPDTFLIRRGDWERMAKYVKEASGALAASEDFQDDLETIFAVSAWILDRKLKLSGAQDRLRFQPLEAALRKRVEALIDALDEKSGYVRTNAPPEQAAGAAPATEAAAKAGGRTRRGWERLARDADDLADDLCILLALYVEHEIITPGSHGAPTSAAAVKGGTDESRHQYALAKEKLEDFLDIHGGRTSAVPQSHVVVTWLWTLGVVLAVSLGWSIFPGPLEAAMQGQTTGGPFYRALDYAFNGFSSYCIPMLVALALRDSGLQSQHWNSLWSDHWTLTLPQTVVVVLVSSAVATLILIAANLWVLALSPGFKLERPWAYVGFQLQYMGPTTLRGAVLAWIVMTLLDAQLDAQKAQSKAQRKSRPKAQHTAQEDAQPNTRLDERLHETRPRRRWSLLPRIPLSGQRNERRGTGPDGRFDAGQPWRWFWSMLWAILAAVMMALVGGLTRAVSALAAAHRYNEGLTDIDRGLIVYAALSSAVIGFLVVYCVSEAVRNSRGGAGFRRVARADAPGEPPQELLAE